MKQTVIVFENVSKHYPSYHHFQGGLKRFLFQAPRQWQAISKSRHEVLKGVGFQVQAGETFGIIGRNGAGKSTTLGLIAQVIRPTAGSVTVQGRVSPLLELGAGFHPELTGRENIVLNGILVGLTRREVLRKLEEIIAFSELEPFIDQPIRTYSTGMLARLGFSVVASLDPEILLIDEILAVGDLEFQKKCLARMQAFKQRGVTMVFVSHALDKVLEICDRVLWLDACSVKMLGRPAEVVAQYAQAAGG